MKRFALAALLLLCAAPALAQQPRPDIVYASAADIQALIAKAKAEPPKPIVLEPIVNLSPYRAYLEYRAMTAPVAVHETEAELMLVLDGAATLVTGGTVTGSTRLNPTNLSGTAIEGGTSQAVAKGDFIFVPQNTPHQLKDVKGALVLMTFHVPRPYPGGTEANPLPDKTYISAADVQAELATARAAPPKPIVSEQLVDLTPYRVQLEYNNVKGNPAVHITQAELMVVIDGAGDFEMGGTLIDERGGPLNHAGSGINGGTTYHLAKGDVIFVPQGTPHYVTSMAPGGLTLMTIHPPRPVPPAQ
jgi:mannose-6-phosphate isomerase-like protein (cupin superfamily)